MPTIGQIRGMLLEEVILHLLGKVGYRIVRPGEDGTSQNGAGLLLRGRGTWHQIDGLAALDYGPAFTYPIRLLVEAKCYSRHEVDISVIRNSLGVLRDVSENYFVQREANGGAEFALPRYNFLSAVFSTSGYTREAQRYALAHQIFLIQYKGILVVEEIVRGLLSLNQGSFRTAWRQGFGPDNSGPAPEYLGRLRQDFRNSLESPEPSLSGELLHPAGLEALENIARGSTEIRGSYYGMIQGQYPLHMLSRNPLPPHLFQRSDEVRCRIYAHRPETWYVEPSRLSPDAPGFFRLEFGLPVEVEELVRRVWRSPQELANAKRANFSAITLSGYIGGVRRQIRLVLDDEWLDEYLGQLR